MSKPKAIQASGIPVHCAHLRIADVTSLIPNPRNPNKHGDTQVALLAKIIRHQGWRAPITISRRSGFVVTGHGRLEAARLLQVETVPVDEQDFATEADEWAHLIADNRIAELAEADRSMLRDLAEELDTGSFDMDLTGFDHLGLEELMTAAPPEQGKNDPNEVWAGMPEFTQEEIMGGAHFCTVRFKNEAARKAFEKFLGYNLSHKGKLFSTWYPKADFDQLGSVDGARYEQS